MNTIACPGCERQYEDDNRILCPFCRAPKPLGKSLHCPAWADGKHCFEHGTTWPRPVHHVGTRAGKGVKGCLCGAVVHATDFQEPK